jgi:CRISPR/Cas system-associated exonuclease Cas4 (RecB family)
MVAAAKAEGIDVNSHADEPGDRPVSLSIVSAAGAPDPLFPEGWQQALRATLADPQWPKSLVPGHTEPYDAAVDQMHMILDDLPAAPEPDAKVAGVDTSVTGLVTLAGCPQRFYWTEVDPLPRRQAPAMRRGVKVHRMIELHGRGEMALDDMADDLYDVTDLDEPVGDTGPDPYQVYLESRFADLKPRYIEAAIDLHLPKGRVRGRIDAVYEPQPGSWEIVDFKSGRNRNDPAAVVQLEAYAVAAAEGALSAEPPSNIKVTFAYLGGGELDEVVLPVDNEWLKEARHHLAELTEAASGPEYPQVPSAACGRCDFLRFCDAGQQYVASH